MRIHLYDDNMVVNLKIQIQIRYTQVNTPKIMEFTIELEKKYIVCIFLLNNKRYRLCIKTLKKTKNTNPKKTTLS